MSIKRLNLFVILAVFLSACGAVPASDWCYSFSFAGGLPTGFSGAPTDGVGIYSVGAEVNLYYSSAPFTPQYVELFFNNSGAQDNIRVFFSGYGGSWDDELIAIPNGVTAGYVSLGSAGSTVDLYATSVASSIRLTGLKFYGNGTNPFPDNECTPSATATPSATSAPSASATPVGLTLDTNSLFSQTNGWISVFVPIFALLVGAPLAIAILVFVGRSIIQALRGGR